MDALLAASAAIYSHFSMQIAGAMGGGIRWWSIGSSFRVGIGHVVAGAIIGTYLGPMIFPLLKPLADFSGILPQDAAALGAHIAGWLGLNIYTIPSDFLRGRALAVKASIGKDTPQ